MFFLDAAGKRTSDIYVGDGYVSDCKPIISNGSVVWYVADNKKLQFYTISADGTLGKIDAI